MADKTGISWTDAMRSRFWSRVDVRGSTMCWPWTRASNPAGYGRIRFSKGGKLHLAHRLAFELDTGRQPNPGMVVMHTCDNPPCCNPSHLKEGTQRDNIEDCIAKGRKRQVRGEGNGQTRLTVKSVLAIRKRIKEGASLRAIARDFDVGHTTIANIKLGKTWRHV